MLEKNSRKFFFSNISNDLYTKMCRIEIKETFRKNVNLPDLSKKNYLRKTVTFLEGRFVYMFRLGT